MSDSFARLAQIPHEHCLSLAMDACADNYDARRKAESWSTRWKAVATRWRDTYLFAQFDCQGCNRHTDEVETERDTLRAENARMAAALAVSELAAVDAFAARVGSRFVAMVALKLHGRELSYIKAFNDELAAMRERAARAATAEEGA